MQPLKITIYGDFWDCQIYMGRLYLWTLEGDLMIYRWDEIIDSLIIDENDRLPLYCAFTRGNYLYRPDLDFIFADSDFKKLLQVKFSKLNNHPFEFKLASLEKFLYGSQDNPFDELPTDTEIINKNLYAVTDTGLWSSTAHRYNRNYPVKSKPEKIWDCKLLSLKANRYNQIALSGGNEGLYEYNPNSAKYYFKQSLQEVEDGIFQVSNRHSLFSNYNYLSIYNSSNVNNSFLALFNWEKYRVEGKEKYERSFERIVSEQEIFNNNGNHKLSWGSQDKIYRAFDHSVEIIKFNNYASEERDEKYFTKLERINLLPWKGDVISGGTSYFGTIIECENALVLALSDGTTLTIPGSATRWRVYPRSINYENHLHVIKEDRIEIYSFNQDYFVNQYDKSIGIFFNKSELIKNRKTSSLDIDLF